MLLGRETETATLDALLSQADAGSGAALVVHGEAGIGKTALLEYARSRSDGFTVLSTRGLQAESELPFAALGDLLRPILGSIDALPDRQASALRAALALGPPGDSDRFAIAAATLSLLAAAAEERPVLALADDAHWIDAASREALLFAARRLGADPMLVLFGVRDGETDGFDDAGVAELALGPLGHESAAQLVSDASGGRAAPEVGEAVALAMGGNPLAILEATGPLTAAQLAGTEDLDPSLLAGTTVELAFLARASRLGDDARAALVVAAAGITDHAGEVEAACALVGIGAGGLREAEAAGLITRRDSFEFSHPLLRAAVYRAAGEDERRAAHAALARALSMGDASDRRAWHQASAATGPEPAVAADLHAIAVAAQARGALGTSAAAFARAAQLTSDDGDRARWLFEAATAEHRTGRSARALQLLETAFGLTTDPLVLADVELLRGEIETWTGDTPHAHRRLEAAGDAVEPVDPRRAAVLLGDAAFAAMLSGHVATGVALARRAHALAEKVDAETAALTAPVLANGILLASADREALPLLLLYERVPLERLAPPALFRVVPPMTWVEEYDRVRTIVDHMIATGRERSAPSVLLPGLFNLAELAFRTGDWDEGYAAGTEAVSVARDASGQMLHLSLVLLARIEAGRGLEADCRAHAAEGVTLGMRLGDGSAVAYGLAALGLLELGLGAAEAAVGVLEQLDGALTGMGVTNPAVVMSAQDLAEARILAGRPDAAADGVAALEADGIGLAWPRAAAARCRGLLASDADYDACFQAALELHAGRSQPFEHARTELSFGERLRRSHRVVEARKHLRSALNRFEALGARPWAERARRELAATGERRRARGPETGELTPRELQVALLVARGATNREAAAALFLTTKTIEFHLGQIYRKLGLRSRTELANRLASVEEPG